MQAAQSQAQEFQSAAALAQAEARDLQMKLEKSEEVRQGLEKELSQLRAEALNWEDVLDALQVLPFSNIVHSRLAL